MEQTALDVLNMRYAKGEISQQEYQSSAAIMLNAKSREIELLSKAGLPVEGTNAESSHGGTSFQG